MDDFLYGQLSHALVLLLLLFCIPQCAKRTGVVWLLQRIIACWRPHCRVWQPRYVHQRMHHWVNHWYWIHGWQCPPRRPVYYPHRQRRQLHSIRPHTAWSLPPMETMRIMRPSLAILCWRSMQIIAVGCLLDKLYNTIQYNTIHYNTLHTCEYLIYTYKQTNSIQYMNDNDNNFRSTKYLFDKHKHRLYT